MVEGHVAKSLGSRTRPRGAGFAGEPCVDRYLCTHLCAQIHRGDRSLTEGGSTSPDLTVEIHHALEVGVGARKITRRLSCEKSSGHLCTHCLGTISGTVWAAVLKPSIDPSMPSSNLSREPICQICSRVAWARTVAAAAAGSLRRSAYAKGGHTTGEQPAS